MEHQPVTTNPVLIMLINMTIVFSVLYGLSWVIRLIQYLDPTKKKTPSQPSPEVAPLPVQEIVEEEDEMEDIIVVLAAAAAAYGYQPSQIVAIRPVESKIWANTARLDVMSTRKQMF